MYKLHGLPGEAPTGLDRQQEQEMRHQLGDWLQTAMESITAAPFPESARNAVSFKVDRGLLWYLPRIPRHLAHDPVAVRFTRKPVVEMLKSIAEAIGSS